MEDAVVPGVPEIRKFDDAAIQRHIDAALSALPAGAKGAVIAHYDVGGSPSLSVYGRLGEHFSYVGTVAWNYGRDIEGEAEVRFTW